MSYRDTPELQADIDALNERMDNFEKTIKTQKKQRSFWSFVKKLLYFPAFDENFSKDAVGNRAGAIVVFACFFIMALGFGGSTFCGSYPEYTAFSVYMFCVSFFMIAMCLIFAFMKFQSFLSEVKDV